MNNPIKLDRIRQQLMHQLAQEENEKREMKERKKRKKEEKKAKKESKKQEERRGPTYDSHGSRKRSRSPCQDRENTGAGSARRDDESRRGRDRGYASAASDLDGKKYRGQDRDREFESCDSRSYSHGHNAESSFGRGSIADKKYGLLGKDSNGDSSKPSGDFLGPKPELLAKIAEKQRQELADKKKPREDVRALTEEERLRRLKAMESNAVIHDDSRMKRVQSSKLSGGMRQSAADLGNREASKESGASFLRSMRSEVYNSSSISMEERLSQNKHYSQRGHDLENASSFMRR